MKSYFLSISFLMLLMCGVVCAEVNINTATAQEMATELTNIGPAKAAAIVEYRQTKGQFQSVNELLNINGIGEATLEMNRELLTVHDPAVSSPDTSNIKPDMTDIATTEKKQQ